MAREERGKGHTGVFLDLGSYTILEPRLSQFPVDTCRLDHRHPCEAVSLTLHGKTLHGKGLSLARKDGLGNDAKTLSIDSQAGSIISPLDFWDHQHFNTAATVARYWIIAEVDFPKRLGIPLEVGQIEAEQEDPSVRRRFEKELAQPASSDVLANPGIHHHQHQGHARQARQA